MISKEIIERLFPEALETPEEIEKRYPPRELDSEAMVTRFAPSPTGFMHIGGLYAALISERLAHQTGGIFYVRIEDTDKKREVAGATELIVASLDHYGVRIDEGQTLAGTEVGKYGPYKQSAREGIYRAYVRSLVERGMAYPCFCTPEELEELHNRQEAEGVRPGYYGQWAKWRDRPEEEIAAALDAGQGFVIRFRSEGSVEEKISTTDLLLGKREFFENDQDIVIMKSDGLPTYHMAHIIDDHLMHTTHVIRGNEWLSSLPLHLQLFAAMGWQPPLYGHIFPIQKMEGASKRKLSKRKDPEADVAYYDQAGYPENAIVEYLLNLANSNFEDWRKGHPEEDNRNFNITFKKLSSSTGPLFDFRKLGDISKEIIATYPAEKVYAQALAWAERHDAELAAMMQADPEYAVRIFGIERTGATKVRKDIAKWEDVRREIEYFFDPYFHLSREEVLSALSDIAPDDIARIVRLFIERYDEQDTTEEWFEKIKEIARSCGYAESAKLFKENPEKYKGTVADVAKIFRVLLTGRTQTPDLHSVMQVMGKERVLARLSLSEE